MPTHPLAPTLTAEALRASRNDRIPASVSSAATMPSNAAPSMSTLVDRDVQTAGDGQHGSGHCRLRLRRDDIGEGNRYIGR